MCSDVRFEDGEPMIVGSRDGEIQGLSPPTAVEGKGGIGSGE